MSEVVEIHFNHKTRLVVAVFDDGTEVNYMAQTGQRSIDWDAEAARASDVVAAAGRVERKLRVAPRQTAPGTRVISSPHVRPTP